MSDTEKMTPERAAGWAAIRAKFAERLRGRLAEAKEAIEDKQEKRDTPS